MVCGVIASERSVGTVVLNVGPRRGKRLFSLHLLIAFADCFFFFFKLLVLLLWGLDGEGEARKVRLKYNTILQAGER